MALKRLTMMYLTACLVSATCAGSAALHESVCNVALEDPEAVTVRGAGNGKANDTQAIQQTIDTAASSGAGEFSVYP